MRKIKTQSTFDKFPSVGEQIKGISLTVPDQSLSVRQLLERSVRGGELRGLSASYLTDDDEGLGIDVDKMDRMEKLELKTQVGEQIEQLRNKKWKTKPKEQAPPSSPDNVVS